MDEKRSATEDKTPADWSVVTGVTPETLAAHWQTQRDPVDIIAFYHDRKGVPWREFSNWYENKRHNFDFVLPLELLELADVSDQQKEMFAPIVHCENSEKAIMLCKAAVMGDAASYAALAESTTPKDAKILGGRVSPWNDERGWQLVVAGVAVAVLRQKFAVPALRRLLISTGDKIICEATAGDKVWAIGVSIKMPKVYEVPARWKGSNILGWALMEVRALIREEEQAAQQQAW